MTEMQTAALITGIAVILSGALALIFALCRVAGEADQRIEETRWKNAKEEAPKKWTWATNQADRTYCEKKCPYHSNQDKRNMEPCLNCPVESYLDFKETEKEVKKRKNAETREKQEAL